MRYKGFMFVRRKKKMYNFLILVEDILAECHYYYYYLYFTVVNICETVIFQKLFSFEDTSTLENHSSAVSADRRDDFFDSRYCSGFRAIRHPTANFHRSVEASPKILFVLFISRRVSFYVTFKNVNIRRKSFIAKLL